MTPAPKINLWMIYSLTGVFLILLVLVGSFYFHYQSNQERLSSLSSSEPIVIESEVIETDSNDWRTIYPNPQPIQIGNHKVLASVAKTMSERITGLSGTPFLPEELVKLFIFDAPGLHSIWMKDMNYPLDIIWVDKNYKIVHVEENVHPESYPNFYTPETPAQYVIEANAGFVAQKEIKLDDMVILPNL